MKSCSKFDCLYFLPVLKIGVTIRVSKLYLNLIQHNTTRNNNIQEYDPSKHDTTRQILLQYFIFNKNTLI